MAKFHGAQKADVWTEWPNTVKSMTIEPKFDGYRLSVIVHEDGTLSYHCGKAEQPDWAENCEHIGAALLQLGLRNVMFDGEAMATTWGETSSLLRRKRSKMDVVTMSRVAEEVRYHVFDLVPLSEISEGTMPGKRKTVSMVATPLRVRYAMLCDALDAYEGDVLRLVSQTVVSSAEDIDVAFRQFVAQGYEGGMAKDLDAPYAFVRSPFWLKLKPWKDMELTVIGAEEGVGKHAGRLGALICTTDDGVEARCGGGFSDAQRDAIWAQWLEDAGEVIGTRIEVTVQDSDVSATRHCNFRRYRPVDT